MPGGNSSTRNARAARLFEQTARHFRARRLDEAHRAVPSLLAAAPADAPIRHLAALIEFQRDNKTAALDHARKALTLEAGSLEYLRTVVQILARLGRTGEALGHLEAGLAIDPDSVPLLDLQAETLLKAGNARGAVAALQRARRIEPENVRVLLRIGEAFRELGSGQQARAAYTLALQIEPENAHAHCGRGLVLLGEGGYEGARADFRRALELDPDFVDPLIQLARLDRAEPGDERIERLERFLRRPDLRAQGKALIGFALGKLYDDCGDYDRAFACFAEANRQRAVETGPATPGPDPEQDTDALIAACDAGFFAERAGFGQRTQLPVFVVGMPRSGTTLIESILARHPRVHGAGELPHISEMQHGLLGGSAPAEWAERLRAAPREAIDRAAATYAVHLQSLAAGAERIVDKMPINFRHLWLIALLFPDARIIHARRDARDTCVSCFGTDFARTHGYRNDLAALGRFHRQYRRLTDHWLAVCPLAQIEIRYEDLVADQETTSRRMVDFLGLDWHPDCLDFHRGDRAVHTASNVQVGRRIYHSSVGRWRNYEAHLGPLLEALADED